MRCYRLGHTVSSQRKLVEEALLEFKEYGKTLRKDQRIIYEEMLEKVYERVGSISYASSIHVWAFVLLSIMFEQELKLNDINRCVPVERQTSLMDSRQSK